MAYSGIDVGTVQIPPGTAEAWRKFAPDVVLTADPRYLDAAISQYIEIRDNSVVGHGLGGIGVGYARYVAVVNNVVTDNGGWSMPETYPPVATSTTPGVEGHGIALTCATNQDIVQGNTVTNNDNIGILLDGAYHVRVEANEVSGSEHGIALFGAYSNGILGNHVFDNTGTGIRIERGAPDNPPCGRQPDHRQRPSRERPGRLGHLGQRHRARGGCRCAVPEPAGRSERTQSLGQRQRRQPLQRFRRDPRRLHRCGCRRHFRGAAPDPRWPRRRQPPAGCRAHRHCGGRRRPEEAPVRVAAFGCGGCSIEFALPQAACPVNRTRGRRSKGGRGWRSSRARGHRRRGPVRAHRPGGLRRADRPGAAAPPICGRPGHRWCWRWRTEWSSASARRWCTSSRQAARTLCRRGRHGSTHRRQGIARAMLDEMFAWGRELGCKEAWLGTELDNDAANALYRAMGGKPDQMCTTSSSSELSPRRGSTRGGGGRGPRRRAGPPAPAAAPRVRLPAHRAG